MADVLEVEDKAVVAKLSKRVQDALDEYCDREGAPTSAKLRDVLKPLSRQCESLLAALNKLRAHQDTRLLQAAARRQIDDAARRLSEPRPEGQFPESFDALTQSVASILVAKLSKRVQDALDEYCDREGAPTSAKLRDVLKPLSRQCESLLAALNKLRAHQDTRLLQAAARRQIDDAARRLSEPRPEGQFPESFDALTQSVASISVILRHAAPSQRRGARSPQQTAARYLVGRLGIIYSQTTNRFPARHYDAHLGEESGLFREFVILAFEAAGISDKPPDTLIRSIWGGLPKKIRARKNYGD